MKIIIENLVAVQPIRGEIDLREVQSTLKGSRFQPEVFKGVIYEMDEPKCEVFLMRDRTIRVHGTRSLSSAEKAIRSVLDRLKGSGFRIDSSGSMQIKEVIASHDMGARLDPKRAMDSFKAERLIYDPRRLPGFILKLRSVGMEVLIFPEGKIVARGARSVEDAASALQMVASRLEGARIPNPPPAPPG